MPGQVSEAVAIERCKFRKTLMMLINFFFPRLFSSRLTYVSVVLRANVEGASKVTSVACVGDPNTHGGFVMTGSSTMHVLGRPVARQFDLVSCPMHGVNEIIEGSDMLTDNGRSIALDGNRCACGCTLIAPGSAASVG
jgi:uncharacterized Zn-binding protein involved in type VI secretion